MQNFSKDPKGVIDPFDIKSNKTIESYRSSYSNKDSFEEDLTIYNSANDKIPFSDKLHFSNSWKETLHDVPYPSFLIKRLEQLNYPTPLTLQSTIIPLLLTKKETCINVQSPPHSGKILSYIIPAITKIDTKLHLQNENNVFFPQSIILVNENNDKAKIRAIAESFTSIYENISISTGESPGHILIIDVIGIISLLKQWKIDLDYTSIIIIDQANLQLKTYEAQIKNLISKLHQNTTMAVYGPEDAEYMASLSYCIGQHRWNIINYKLTPKKLQSNIEPKGKEETKIDKTESLKENPQQPGDVHHDHEVESKKYGILHEGDVKEEQIEEIVIKNKTKMPSADLQYLLTDKTWKETLQKFPNTDPLIEKLLELGYIKPSQIQCRTIPFLLSKQEVGLIAQSHNGSGKTLAFAIPAVLKVDLNLPLRKSDYCFSPQILIVEPHPELMLQVASDIKRVASAYKDLKVTTTNEPGHILVKTSQKILGLLRRKELDLSQLKMLIIDEADEQLKEEALVNINHLIHKISSRCGLGFFSATFSPESIDAIDELLMRMELTVLKYLIKSEELKLEGIYQFSKKCPPFKKGDYIDKLLDSLNTDVQILIFVNTKKYAQFIYDFLKNREHPVALLMGDIDIVERIDILNHFREAKYKILITTNLLARGFDQRTIGLVINLDIPRTFGEGSMEADYKTYLHRIGRTGRFGDTGLVVNLYSSDFEKRILDDIASYYKIPIEDLNSIEDEKSFDMMNDCLEQLVQMNKEKREKLHETIKNYSEIK